MGKSNGGNATIDMNDPAVQAMFQTFLATAMGNVMPGDRGDVSNDDLLAAARDGVMSVMNSAQGDLLRAIDVVRRKAVDDGTDLSEEDAAALMRGAQRILEGSHRDGLTRDDDGVATTTLSSQMAEKLGIVVLPSLGSGGASTSSEKPAYTAASSGDDTWGDLAAAADLDLATAEQLVMDFVQAVGNSGNDGTIRTGELRSRVMAACNLIESGTVESTGGDTFNVAGGRVTIEPAEKATQRALDEAQAELSAIRAALGLSDGEEANLAELVGAIRTANQGQAEFVKGVYEALGLSVKDNTANPVQDIKALQANQVPDGVDLSVIPSGKTINDLAAAHADQERLLTTDAGLKVLADAISGGGFGRKGNVKPNDDQAKKVARSVRTAIQNDNSAARSS